MTSETPTKKKTWFRETAIACLIWLGFLSFQGDVQIVEILTWPVTIIALSAFGVKNPIFEKVVERKMEK